MPAIMALFDCVQHTRASGRLYDFGAHDAAVGHIIRLKNGRTEYEVGCRQPEVTVTCVRDTPYLIRDNQPCLVCAANSEKPIPMNDSDFANCMIAATRGPFNRIAQGTANSRIARSSDNNKALEDTSRLVLQLISANE